MLIKTNRLVTQIETLEQSEPQKKNEQIDAKTMMKKRSDSTFERRNATEWRKRKK